VGNNAADLKGSDNLALKIMTRLVQVSKKTNVQSSAKLCDNRFSKLLAREAWERLPASIRARFSKRLVHGATSIFCGEMVEMRASNAGHCLAQLLRLIGAPLPLHLDIHVPSVVTVTEDVKTSGQIWIRLYARSDGFPQIIQSAKRFAGPTGLEEYIGSGITITLKVTAEENALIFKSDGYLLGLGRFRIRIPAWLAQIAVEVRHQSISNTQFLFVLDVRHIWFGELIHQSGIYKDSA
jgi:Domain of unknown function (DUF4166)